MKRTSLPQNSTNDTHIAVTQFQAVTFFDKKLERQIIILYALGEDGIVREFTNGVWNPYPVKS